MKAFYVSLCILGTALPLYQFIPWLLENGFSAGLLFDEAFGSRLSAFAWFDVIISGVVVLGFIVADGHYRLKMKNLAAPVVALFIVGVSLALPLFLLLREYRLEEDDR